METKSNGISEVEVTDFNMPFWSMVLFMVKWSIAAIPALIVLAGVGFLVSLLATFLGILGG